jgi:RNA polymerase sigma-70 factor, ECF subfamily
MESTTKRPPQVCRLPDDDTLLPLLKRLLGYARTKLRNEAMAEDAVSETLLAALEAQGDFDSPTRTSAWLFGVLKHKLVDQLRALSRVQPAGDLADELDQQQITWSGAWHDGRSAAHDPEGICHRKQAMALLKQACDALPAAQAQAFQMREVLDMDTERICECLGVTPGHLWVMTHRVRRHLRLELARQGATPGD